MKKRNLIPTLCFAGGAALILSLQGCTSSTPSKAWTPELKTDTKEVVAAVEPASEEYFEIEHEGRIFVIGEAEMAEKFEKLHHLPYTQTMIGAGPKGETVIVQVDKDNPEFQDRLWAQFKEAHLFYTEIAHNERTYVLGDKDMAEKFEKLHHLPYTRTFIGAASDGGTLILQVDKKNPALVQRLQREYARRNNVSL